MRKTLLTVALTLIVPTLTLAQTKVDPKLPEYKKTDGVEGRIKSEGSDTMNNLMTAWTEGFIKLYDSNKVQAEIVGKGSSSAPPALTNGTANFGAMSRAMTNKEIGDFKKQQGYEPTALTTSLDVLAVYVHKDNPIKGLTLAQVDAVFSKTRKSGHTEVKTWGDLGLTGEWADKPINIYGRNAASGTYGFFKEVALKNGDFKDVVKEQPGSSGVVQGVASDKYAIGYSGIGYKTADVRAVPLSVEEKKPNYVEADAENAYSGDYPMTRPLFVYINYKPGSDLDALRREFIKYIYSKQGQADVVKSGYLPITAKVADKALTSLGIK